MAEHVTPTDQHIWQLDAVRVLDLILATEIKKPQPLPPLAWRLPGGRDLIGEPQPGTDQEKAATVRAWAKSLYGQVQIRDLGHGVQRHTVSGPFAAAGGVDMVTITITTTVDADQLGGDQ
ncbi:MAG TPA: hypothetical protein DD420_32180 [Streptomyces sp.]|uniref:hypothetical protein n=1 Tax=Streptomyces sp. SID3915 TaxID=2690263 RepID=UPI000E8C2738|nr:hypothetical protein [Streptomyces sp. SID3915]MYX75077.1 hypothetical protein [Streptomyces sp. SID3915]MYX75090.1 hypothetical protein [Streptomyces sp. SID3915]HBF84421.1 hypothetical protein [Streptomyces sp.]